MNSKEDKLRESRKRAYENFKESKPEKLNVMRRKASKKFYESHKEQVKEKCRNYARYKRDLSKIESNEYLYNVNP